jgi:ABC-type glycerol-3-phosphate transport system permease component
MPALDEMSFRFILAVLVLIVGLLFLFGLFRFGTTLFGTQSSNLSLELRELLMNGPGPDPRRYPWWTDSLSNWYQTYLEKRNDFWEHYGQVALAVLIVVVLAVLLLSKVISAEAGLPILSAVAGFAIAKTSGSSMSNRRPEPPNPNES